MTRLNLDILPQPQRALWPQLAATSQLGLVLYGGTAIALYYGHRESVDFDFFSSNPVHRRDIQRILPFTKGATVLQDAPDTWVVLLQWPEAVTVKLSFFGSIGIGRFGVPLVSAEGVQIASPEDLLATKLKVLFDRVEWKDYRDISVLLENNVDLAKGISIARKMFGHEFQPSECLKALTYFKGGDLHLLSEQDRFRLVSSAASVRDIPEVELATTLHGSVG